jgi:transcriptional regulator with XRE-family HTH domain
MKVCEKIRQLRQEKGWSQEDIANKLNLSVNAYGSIERGETDVNLSRLQAISDVFEVELADLFDKKEANVFNNFGHVETNNQQHSCTVNLVSDYERLKFETEKYKILLAEREKENLLLRELIEWIKKEN